MSTHLLEGEEQEAEAGPSEEDGEVYNLKEGLEAGSLEVI